jgi:hypothetical protein
MSRSSLVSTARVWICGGLLMVGAVWMFPAAAVSSADLSADLIADLKEQGLVNAAVPLASFRWVLEQKRPLRPPRWITEEFAAAPDGLSSVKASTRFSGEKIESREYVSARGLLRYDASDTKAGVRLDSFSLPLRAEKSFHLSLVRDDTPLNQSCRVIDKVNAQRLHDALPGQAWRLQCDGDSRFSNMPVRIQSMLYFIEALGVFFSEHDQLDSPLGQFTMSQRILDFKLLATP